MKEKLKNTILIILVMILFTACDFSYSENEAHVREEEKLVVYTSHKEEVYSPIIDEFEERTGIWVQVISGGTSEVLELIKEDSGNEVIGDVMFGGGVESLDAYSTYFAPYECSESEFLKDDFQSVDHKWTVFSQLPIVLIYNNKLVYDAEAPKGWEDLLEERWKGKIAFADPHISGTGFTSLMTLMHVMGKDNTDALEKFTYVLDGKTLDGSGKVISEVNAGTKLVGLTLEDATMTRIMNGGDITMVYPIEGTSAVPDGSAILLGAPHEENARLFIDFVMSEDVQRMIVNQCYRRSMRKDISQPETWEAKDITFIDYDLTWASNNRNEILKNWDELNK